MTDIMTDAEIAAEVFDFDADLKTLFLDVCAARAAKPDGQKTKLRALSNALQRANVAFLEAKGIAKDMAQ